MPFDSNGNYTLPTSYFVENGDTVLPIQHNPPFEDVAQALSLAILRDGRSPMSGDLKMGGKKIINLADATATTDAVTKQQLDALAAIVADPWGSQPIGAFIHIDDGTVGHFQTFCKLNGYDFRNSALGGTGYSATAGAQNILGQMDSRADGFGCSFVSCLSAGWEAGSVRTGFGV
ncbi:hypothetical protein [Agrobacterium tumefaciens]|uniref:hypothetical protein n=1 Tax=Agrobacterium tumefaciens TaxID=358 RepID=UPI001FA9CD87|nr:hypothetical protein [Agrobacterium tumefaciens]UNZ49315.1 hypothetical protein MLE07_07910 [Agrobacterium tumefaciens]